MQRFTAAGSGMVGPPSRGRKDQETACRQPLDEHSDFDLSSSLLVPAITALTTIAFAQTHEATGAHADPVAPVVLALAIILAAAKLGGHLAVRMGQPAVLGELVAGVARGSADLTGIGWFHAIEGDQTVDILARLGVVSSGGTACADR